MASAAFTGLLKGLGQGAAIVGEKALNEKYEELRAKKRQQYDVENLEKRITADNERAELQYTRDVERDGVNHERTKTLEGIRHQNSLASMEKQDGLLGSRQQKQNQWELDNKPKAEAYLVGEDGQLMPADGKMPHVVEKDGEFADYRPKQSKQAIESQQKKELAYLKRKQGLEDMLAEGLIDKEKFDGLLLSARQDYGVSSPARTVTKDDVLKAFMAANKGVDESTAIGELSKSEKYGHLFNDGSSSGGGLLEGDSMEAKKARAAESIRKRQEEDRRQLEKAQKEAEYQRRYKEESGNQLSLIEQYNERMRNQEGN